MSEESDIDMTWGANKDLLLAISFIRIAPWIEGEEDFHIKCLLRELLQKCSGGKIIEMLKSILSPEERNALIKTEFEIKTEENFEKHYIEIKSENSNLPLSDIDHCNSFD